MQKTIKIPNHLGEELDTLVEGKEDAETTIIFVHGFGTSKHESASFFDDIAKHLRKEYLLIRFDFSGYAQSQGREEDACYSKQTKDLKKVIEYTRNNFPGKINLLAHSMGTMVSSLLSPKNIQKTIFTGIINTNTNHVINFFQDRIESKRGEFNEYGITTYPRSSGAVQKVGSQFWLELRSIKPLRLVSNYAEKTNLLIVHPKQDEIIGNKYLDGYKSINAKYLEIDGDHSFTKAQDRQHLIKVIEDFLAEKS